MKIVAVCLGLMGLLMWVAYALFAVKDKYHTTDWTDEETESLWKLEDTDE